MTEDTYRRIGALAGLGVGIGLMFVFGLRGILAGAVFGAAGCVAGAITAEKLYAWKNQQGE